MTGEVGRPKAALQRAASLLPCRRSKTDTHPQTIWMRFYFLPRIKYKIRPARILQKGGLKTGGL